MSQSKISQYLDGYRDNIVTKTTLLDYIDSASSISDLVVIYKHADQMLSELAESSSYVTEFAYGSLHELVEIYDNLDSKISYIENSLSNFLNINTSEYAPKRIESFKNLLGSGLKHYNKFLNGYSLQQSSSNYKINPVSIKSSGNVRVETYILPKAIPAIGYEVHLNNNSTIFQEVSFLNNRNELLKKHEIISATVPDNTYRIIVLTVDQNTRSSYTKLSVLENTYNTTLIIPQPPVTISPGKLLRLHVEGEVPEGCYATAALDIQLLDANGVEITTGAARIGLLGDGMALVTGLEAKDPRHTVVQNLNKNLITRFETEDSKYCLTQSYADGAFKYLGNNCIELPHSKIDTIKVSTTLMLTSTNTNKTPLIRSLIGYITND